MSLMCRLLQALALAGCFAALGNGSPARATGLSTREAAQYFTEADALVRADGGRLWGVSLGGGLLLVDPATRIAYANQPDSQGRLVRVGPVLRGEIPQDVNLANTALDWAGGRWSMILLPLPEDRPVRATLILHELWHRVQDQLGFPATSAPNDHLDSREGRYWLQLEWRALGAALVAAGPKQREAIADAALFRALRRAIFPKAAAEENAMEMHEGLAEYTGVKLSGATDLAHFVLEHELKEAPAMETFVRSFAYANGPAYGLLLDGTGRPWRDQLKPTTDLGATLLRLARITLPNDLRVAAKKRALVYDGAALGAQEDAREQTRQARAATYRARLVEGPVLKIPLQEMNLQFDPGNLLPLDLSGTVYPNLRIVDRWGILTVTSGGALLSADFSQVTLPAPLDFSSATITGDGWSLELRAGWSIVPGQRKGDLQLQSASTSRPSP